MCGFKENNIKVLRAIFRSFVTMLGSLIYLTFEWEICVSWNIDIPQLLTNVSVNYLFDCKNS